MPEGGGREECRGDVPPSLSAHGEESRTLGSAAFVTPPRGSVVATALRLGAVTELRGLANGKVSSLASSRPLAGDNSGCVECCCCCCCFAGGEGDVPEPRV